MKYFIGIIALMMSTFSFGQTLENQGLIVQFLGQEKYDQILQSNPNYLQFLDTRCSYGYQIIDYVDEKMNTMTVLSEIVVKDFGSNGHGFSKGSSTKGKLTITPEEFVQALDSENFNILMYYLSYDRSQITYYVLGNTGKVILLFPVEYINTKLNSK